MASISLVGVGDIRNSIGIILALSFIVYALYKCFKDSLLYWERKGYPYIKGSFPLGTTPNRFFSAQYQGVIYQDFYNQLAPHSYGGLYLYRKPELLIRDPELVKLVLVKDFSHFRSRFGKAYSKSDPFSMHLFNLEGDLWKSMRVKLAPTFTSGKLKMLFPLFEECANQFNEALNHALATSNNINVKDIFSRYTMNVIATCAFGLKVETLNDPDSEFSTHVMQIFPNYIRFMVKLRIFLFAMFPFLKRLFWIRTLLPTVDSFMKKMIKETVDHREANNVKRNDFINLLLEIKQKEEVEGHDGVQDSEMDMCMITAQCFVFLAAGFETASSVQSYALYEMALNQSIQDRLRAEIMEVLAKHGGKPTYYALQDMRYLDQVIYETMRKYPTLPILTRECSRDYKSKEFGLELEKGIGVVIPIYALHHDPTYFPEPAKFDPDRFSEENKSSIPQYAFLPFGEGPRLCIGSRFGLIQTKLGLVTVLSRLRVLPAANTQVPLEFVSSWVVTTAKGDIRLKFENLKN